MSSMWLFDSYNYEHMYKPFPALFLGVAPPWFWPKRFHPGNPIGYCIFWESKNWECWNWCCLHTKPLAASITETEAITTDQNSDEHNVDSSATSPVNNSNSNSIHATLASDVVKELRELSALDSSSFEEESSFLLNSFLFRFVRRLIPGSSKLDENKSDDQVEEQEERAFDEISENSPVHAKEDDMPAMNNQVFVGPREECHS